MPSFLSTSLLRALGLFFLSALALSTASGCVSDADHEALARELHRSQLESMQRASEIAALRQFIAYSASSQPQAANQMALNQLWRAYSELAARYGSLASDVESLKRHDAERREHDEAAPSPAAAPRNPSRPRARASDGLGDSSNDLFRDR